MAHFAGFDSIRNGIEVSSITKHTERLTFGFLGIKEIYNQQPLSVVWTALWPAALVEALAAATAVALAGLTTSRYILQRRP